MMRRVRKPATSPEHRERGTNMKHLIILAALAGMLSATVGTASASQTITASIYRSPSYTCSAGATDVSGVKYGTFTAVETSGVQWVSASVTVDDLYPFR